MTKLENQIASDLLRIKAVTLRPEAPFTWASGLKSPATQTFVAKSQLDWHKRLWPIILM